MKRIKAMWVALQIGALGLLLTASSALAVTITYVNVGPADSRVVVGFDNNASGYMTSDVVADPAAYHRSDTAYGPLPPAGQLANYDAKAYASAELGTNLNAPLGNGVRSVFTPFNPTFFQAHGETLQSTGSYTSYAFARSGNTASNGPTAWIIHVDPSPGETIGTPTQVTIDASIAGVVSAAGTSLADAYWNVSTTLYGGVIAGSATQAAPGVTPFSDASTLTFVVPLGSTFELLVDYDLSTSGSGAGANSTSEVTASLVQVSAALMSVTPQVAVLCTDPVVIQPRPHRVVPLRRAYEIDNPDHVDVDVEVRLFSNEPFRTRSNRNRALLVPAERHPRGDGRFYLLVVSAQSDDSTHHGVCVGGVVPLHRGESSLERLLQEATAVATEVEAAMAETDPANLDPSDFALFEAKQRGRRLSRHQR